MGVKIGDINIAEQIIDLRFQILRLSKILEYIVNNNELNNKPSPDDIKAIEEECLEILNKNFPNMGIKRKT
nr:hypothetical protein 7 [bacterium]